MHASCSRKRKYTQDDLIKSFRTSAKAAKYNAERWFAARHRNPAGFDHCWEMYRYCRASMRLARWKQQLAREGLAMDEIHAITGRYPTEY